MTWACSRRLVSVGISLACSFCDGSIVDSIAWPWQLCARLQKYWEQKIKHGCWLGIGESQGKTMRALVWHGKEDIRYDRVSDPEIEHPRDAIVKITSCAICGSDLHLYHNFVPAMLPGDIIGHEMMGEVVEVGSGVNGRLKKGERVVVPFTIICGECDQCKRGNFSVCRRSNRNKALGDKVFGHATAGLFGYTHLTGGYPGGQAEYLRVPFADTTHIKVPEDNLSDEQLLFLSDIFPTGWQAAVQCDIQPTDTVA